mmetsp:Transcript_7191/g.21265  ORF Transcript_7191/g.21265 Transcript_7191/m.21265 type:complete len:543 (+) Transcript_7191:1508-3136(+)
MADLVEKDHMVATAEQLLRDDLARVGLAAQHEHHRGVSRGAEARGHHLVLEGLHGIRAEVLLGCPVGLLGGRERRALGILGRQRREASGHACQGTEPAQRRTLLLVLVGLKGVGPLGLLLLVSLHPVNLNEETAAGEREVVHRTLRAAGPGLALEEGRPAGGHLLQGLRDVGALADHALGPVLGAHAPHGVHREAHDGLHLLAVHELVRDEVNALAREHEVGAESFAGLAELALARTHGLPAVTLAVGAGQTPPQLRGAGGRVHAPQQLHDLHGGGAHKLAVLVITQLFGQASDNVAQQLCLSRLAAIAEPGLDLLHGPVEPLLHRLLHPLRRADDLAHLLVAGELVQRRVPGRLEGVEVDGGVDLAADVEEGQLVQLVAPLRDHHVRLLAAADKADVHVPRRHHVARGQQEGHRNEALLLALLGPLPLHEVAGEEALALQPAAHHRELVEDGHQLGLLLIHVKVLVLGLAVLLLIILLVIEVRRLILILAVAAARVPAGSSRCVQHHSASDVRPSPEPVRNGGIANEEGLHSPEEQGGDPN